MVRSETFVGMDGQDWLLNGAPTHSGREYRGWGYFDPGAATGGQSASGNYTDGYQNNPVNWDINTPRN